MVGCDKYKGRGGGILMIMIYMLDTTVFEVLEIQRIANPAPPFLKTIDIYEDE